MPAVVVIHEPVVGSRPSAEPFRIVPFDEPIVDAMNLGITRGDGIFESVGIRHGYVHEEEAHLTRFANSARILELPAPNADAYREAVRIGYRALGGGIADAYAKYVLTRGIEARESDPFGYAFVDVNPDWSRERTQGIRVVTLDRGYPLNVAQTSPWLLQGAKTLSYAVNRAAIREAARRGADDVVFTTTDGYALEGPTATLILRFGDAFVTPSPDFGVLHGTGQLGAYRWLAALGMRTEYRPVRAEELRQADQMWLVNSQRLAAPIRALDGEDVTIDRAFTDGMNEYLRDRRS
ncbi:aminotransferase class IV [Microbacterium betulae]|uniref:Aminotransferase class IV n=1 Tax=Microbacterium betulae TaxID=2981139 RepID=A0AA97I7B3_9MICO|nr:aminotransferase class IV [Microbacterium sp. AB]WOF23250.1 aminotransferase class IV [Microbacterium sp. AB]